MRWQGYRQRQLFLEELIKTKLLELINGTTVDEMRKYDRTSNTKMKRHLDTMLNVWLKKDSLYLRVLKSIQSIKCLHKPVTSSLTLQLKLQRIR